ncbi:protein FAM8A1-like [Drosophila elegans]|uniref:protein FAM8A1-like n=1 Tax=Drosophila elegans TaxID=30023 RepID=UPI0007E7DBEF|nr:protein FAM8A1-like [Drosophila elegans]
MGDHTEQTNQKQMSAKDEYFAKLAKWVEETNRIQTFNAMLSYYMWMNYFQQLAMARPVTERESTPLVEEPEEPRRNVFVMAPMWKRIAAEAIDRTLILFLVIIIARVASRIFFGIASLDSFGLFNEPVMLLFLFEIPRCFIEALWCFGYDGLTPGKLLLGLCVVEGEIIIPLQVRHHLVLITRIQPPSLSNCIIRVLVKNLVPIFFLPMFLRDNRTPQDILTKTVVLELRALILLN